MRMVGVMRAPALLLTLLLTLPLTTGCGHETGNAGDRRGEEGGGGAGGAGGPGGAGEGIGDGDIGVEEGEGEPGPGDGGGAPGGGEAGDESPAEQGAEGEGEAGGDGDEGAEGELPAGEGEGEPPLGEGEGEGQPPLGEGEGEGQPPLGGGEGEGEGDGPPPFGECRGDAGCAPYFKHCDVCDWICAPQDVPVHDCRNLCPNEQDRGEPPQCKCDGGACQAVRPDPPGPGQCEQGRECIPFLDHCDCRWTCRPQDQQDDCDAECGVEVERGPRPLCDCSRRGGCEIWQPRCSDDNHCPQGQTCWLTRICGPGPNGQMNCGDFQGDGQCHAPCAADGVCEGDTVCTDVTIWHGDAGEIRPLCTPQPECGDPRVDDRLGGCAIGHRPGNCCGCGQPMPAADIAADQCITAERDDPVPPECQRDNCDAVDCAQCFQPTRPACAGSSCVAYHPARP